MANEISKPQPPALPLPPVQYGQRSFDQFNNVLRLFFRRLVGAIDNLLSTDDGGKFLYFPRGLFYDITDQTAAAINTGYPVEFGTAYIDNGVTVENDTEITVQDYGVYNFQVTLQFTHTNSSACNLYVWINKNGTDVTYGGKRYTIKGNDYSSISWNFSIDLDAGQYIEMYWATDDTGLELHADAPTSPHPGIPSAVVAVTFVSNL
jgi:hypothetical protein